MRRVIGIAVSFALGVVAAGCAAHGLKSENADLKAQVSALQAQVEDLRAENARLASVAFSPVMIDGLKLEPPKFGELRFTPAAPSGARTFNGPNRFITVADTTALTVGGLNMSGKIPAGGAIMNQGELQITGVGNTTFHKSAAPATTNTTTTKTVPAATPQK